MHLRRHFANPTPPKRCDAIGTEPPFTPCRKVVFKAGMCAEHYTAWVNAKEDRRLNVTVKRLGTAEDGSIIYQPPLVSGCVGKYYRCRNAVMIMYEKLTYCQKCFMKMQKGLEHVA